MADTPIPGEPPPLTNQVTSDSDSTTFQRGDTDVSREVGKESSGTQDTTTSDSVDRAGDTDTAINALTQAIMSLSQNMKESNDLNTKILLLLERIDSSTLESLNSSDRHTASTHDTTAYLRTTKQDTDYTKMTVYADKCMPDDKVRDDKVLLKSYFGKMKIFYRRAAHEGQAITFLTVLQDLWPEAEFVPKQPINPEQWFAAIKTKVINKCTIDKWMSELAPHRVTLQTVQDKKTFEEFKTAVKKLTSEGRNQLDYAQFARAFKFLFSGIHHIEPGISRLVSHIYAAMIDRHKQSTMGIEGDNQIDIEFSNDVHDIEFHVLTAMEDLLNENIKKKMRKRSLKGD
ncbi:hypothetical protein DICA4_B00694 [Diutina catenulata]